MVFSKLATLRHRGHGRPGRTALVLTAATALTGCATLDAGHDTARIEALLAQHGAPSPGWDRNGESDAGVVGGWLAQQMTADVAVRIAMVRSPRLQQIYGELGLAHADILSAVQVANPRVGLSSLAVQNGPGSQFIVGIAAPLVDLITLPSRTRLARLEQDRARFRVAGAVLTVSLDVESAWYRYVGAEQVAGMRGAVADALQTSADLAQRFFDAGNITELQLNREMATASSARIAASRALVDSKMARLDLDTLIGIRSTETKWTTAAVLPLPVEHEDDPIGLRTTASESSLELLAARKEAAIFASSARSTRALRLLGGTSIGYDREREVDGSVIRGPTLDLEVPIFNQGGARVARADAQLRIAKAKLAQIEISTDNAIDLAAERVQVLSDIVRIHREALVPQREIVAARSQDEENYALIGEFEVLMAKTQEYDAYQGFLEAVRDYWIARVDLTRLVGSRLPSEKEAIRNTPSVGEILHIGAPASPSGGHAGHMMSPMPAADHSGHMAPSEGTSGSPMPDPAPPDPSMPPSPHAGHDMPATTPTEHAGHMMSMDPSAGSPEKPAASTSAPSTTAADAPPDHHHHQGGQP